MNITASKVNDKTQRLLKSAAIITLTFLLLTGGTAYASHSHHGYNSGLSISLGYVYYPKVDLHQDVYSYPRYGHHSRNNHYRANYGHHKPWRSKHARKHHGKHHGKRHSRHYDY